MGVFSDRKKTKLLLIRGGFVLIFIVLMCFADRLLCLKTMHGSSQCLAMYAQPRNTVDVVMLGSSHMHCDVNPAILWGEHGIASYVFSAAEQPTWITYYYLLEFCKYQSPKLVVMDLYSPAKFKDDFGIAWVGENIYNIRPSLNKLRMILSTCSLDEIKDYFPSFFGYHSRYDNLDKKDLDYLIPSANEADFKGYTPFFGKMSGMKPVLDVEEKGNIEPKSEEYLEKIIEYTKEHDIELFLVVNPYPVTAEQAEIYNRIQEIAEEKEVPFLNANYYWEEMGLDFENDYNDESHLNYSGGCKYTTYLGNLLKERYDLPDRRGDKRYISWQRNKDNLEEKYAEKINN